MRLRSYTLLLATACFTVASQRLSAETATFGSVADAALFEFRPDNNQGGMLDVPAGSLGDQNGATARNRALFKFDVAGQIPQNATIESVTLTLYANIEPPTPASSEFYLHRMLVDWGEGVGIGNQGTQATLGEVTWNSRFHEVSSWFEPGGSPDTDYAATGSASQFVSSAQTSFQWGSTVGMVADVQAWVQNPATNHGWMLISDSEGTSYTAKRFATREYGTESLRPRLEVTYSVIPEPTTLGLGALALASALVWRRFRA